MTNIQKTLDSFQPYVIGIRYIESVAVIDTVFKEGWVILENPKIVMTKGDESMNYYMIFSEHKNIGLDELLAHINKIIKVNIDRENKSDLLRAKVIELKEVFKKNPLARLKDLTFTFKEQSLDSDLDSVDNLLNDTQIEEEEVIEEEIIENEAPYQENQWVEPTQQNNVDNPATFLDEHGNPIELTEEEKEILEEEARGQRNFQRVNKLKTNPKGVELPPRNQQIRQPIVNNDYSDSECSCDENEACGICIHSKSL